MAIILLPSHDLQTAADRLLTGHRDFLQLPTHFSQAPGAQSQLAEALARRVDAPSPVAKVVLIGDDTVFGHPRTCVFNKARRRVSVRSLRTFTAWRYGHKWVVLAVLVHLSWATRPWALPVLADLYGSEEDDRLPRRPHRPPAQIMATLLRVSLLRVPDRRFVLEGDAGYGTHDPARFRHRHRRRPTLVSKLHPEADLFELPGPYGGNGRFRVEGAALPKPGRAAAAAELQTGSVGWYGGTREVGITTGAGHWYKSGEALVPIGWVFVRDRTGTHRDEYFFNTDPQLDPVAMIEAYTGRWNPETTFQESR